MHPPRPRPRRRQVGCAGLFACALAAGGCGRDEGVVEIAWTFVDRSGAAIYPDGDLEDTCALRGTFRAGENPRTYELHTEVRICDPACEAGCDDAACWLEEPLRFGCDTARGSGIVASHDEPVLIDVRVTAYPGGDSACACALGSPCAQVPGPRRRMIRPGLVTDLQVYLLVLDLPAAAEPLEACCELPPECP